MINLVIYGLDNGRDLMAVESREYGYEFVS
jgi:hypothetical protein